MFASHHQHPPSNMAGEETAIGLSVGTGSRLQPIRIVYFAFQSSASLICPRGTRVVSVEGACDVPMLVRGTKDSS